MPEQVADQPPGALEAFMTELAELRANAGNPSFRKMAFKSGAVSHATLHLTVTGSRLQPWETVREFVRACDGDESEWHARWERTRLALSGDEEPPNGNSGGSAPRAWWRSARLLVPLALVVVAMSVALAMGVFTGDPAPGPPDPRQQDGPVYPGDGSSFIADVTIPDGTVVEPGEQFVKVWEIQNTGSVRWHDRYLERTDMPLGPKDCRTPGRIPVGNTSPGERIKIAVDVRAPSTAHANCMVRWKMIDESGRLLFPSSRPVYFLVHVRR